MFFLKCSIVKGVNVSKQTTADTRKQRKSQSEKVQQHKSAPNHYTNTENAMRDGPDASSQQEGCGLKGHFHIIMAFFFFS